MLKSRINKLFRIFDKKLQLKKFIAFQKLKSTIIQKQPFYSNSNSAFQQQTNETKRNENNDKALIIHNILQKIKQNARKIFQFYEKKILFAKQINFIKWKETCKNQKLIEVLKAEFDKRSKTKYDGKMEELEKLSKKLNEQSKEIKAKMDTFEKNFLSQQKKLNDFEIKEKEFFKQNKQSAEEKNHKLENLSQAKDELKANYSKIENYVKELEKTYQLDIDNQNEKEIFLNNYVNEMNSLLDFYEMKSRKIIFNSLIQF